MKKTIQLILLTAIASVCFASGGHDNSTAESVSPDAEVLNKVCPVMPDMKVNPDIFTDYKGKRIHFCCPNCIKAFEKNPKEYLDRLPQFASESESEHSDHEHSEASSFPYFRFIKPMALLRSF